MNLRRLRVRQLALQGGAVPQRHWVRRHEWHYLWALGKRPMEVGRVESFRFVESAA